VAGPVLDAAGRNARVRLFGQVTPVGTAPAEPIRRTVSNRVR